MPTTVSCSFDAHKLYITKPSEALDIVRTRLSELLAESEEYSVKSCTSPEDSYAFSLSGKSRKHSNIKGIDAILEAVKYSWESESIETATRDRKLDEKLPLMSVVIQETPHVNLSGVVFTCNPVTSADEVVVEATNQGLNPVTVQDSIPSRWVYKRGDWTQRPENQENREKVIGEIVKTAQKIARAFSSSVALEWVFDGSRIYWLQVGLISKIDRINIYSNRISREFLPGVIRPLVWSVNIPVVNSSWKALFKELVGPMADGIDVNSLARSFYYRAYFNMDVVGDIFDLLGIPRESLEILSGIATQDEKRSRFRPGAKAVRYAPRILLFALKKLAYSKQIEYFLKKKTKQYASLARIDPSLLDASKCLAAIDELFKLNTEASYVVIVTQLLNSLYNMILQKHLKRQQIDGYRVESGETSERLQSVDPRYHLTRLNSLYNKLPGDVAKRFEVMEYSNIIDDINCCEFGAQLSLFIRRFGHLSDSGNDFSTPSWREDPHLIVNMITQYKPIITPSQQTSDQSVFKNSPKKSIITKILDARAAKYREYRMAVTFVYSFGYWLFRKYFLSIAEIWLSKGYFESKDDIFYLDLEEIRALAREKTSYLELRKRIVKRKAEVERYRNITLPDIIFGDLPENALVTTEASREFSGVPTSRGHYVGPARLVKSVRDFDKIQQGDVLVIPYSDISWTPVFSKARAVVSESGGILSHCSIVAREYSIPAVVSVKGALTIKDGTRIAVDGYKGTVRVLTE